MDWSILEKLRALKDFVTQDVPDALHGFEGALDKLKDAVHSVEEILRNLGDRPMFANAEDAGKVAELKKLHRECSDLAASPKLGSRATETTRKVGFGAPIWQVLAIKAIQFLIEQLLNKVKVEGGEEPAPAADGGFVIDDPDRPDGMKSSAPKGVSRKGGPRKK